MQTSCRDWRFGTVCGAEVNRDLGGIPCLYQPLCPLQHVLIVGSLQNKIRMSATSSHRQAIQRADDLTLLAPIIASK